jgi:hypothetical protein
MSNPLRDSSRIFSLVYDVVDEIDELVNESLKHRDEEYFERCDVCGGEWHALTGTAPRGPGKLGCPGVFANDEARRVFQILAEGSRVLGESDDSRRGLDCSYAEMDGIPVNPHTLQPFSDDVPHYCWGTDL